MKIVFEDGIIRHEYEERSERQHYENGKPINIIIYSSKSTRLGWAMKLHMPKLDDFKVISNRKTTHE